MYSGSDQVKTMVSPAEGLMTDGSKPIPCLPFVSSMPTVTCTSQHVDALAGVRAEEDGEGAHGEGKGERGAGEGRDGKE